MLLPTFPNLRPDRCVGTVRLKSMRRQCRNHHRQRCAVRPAEQTFRSTPSTHLLTPPRTSARLLERSSLQPSDTRWNVPWRKKQRHVCCSLVFGLSAVLVSELVCFDFSESEAKTRGREHKRERTRCGAPSVHGRGEPCVRVSSCEGRDHLSDAFGLGLCWRQARNRIKNIRAASAQKWRR